MTALPKPFLLVAISELSITRRRLLTLLGTIAGYKVLPAWTAETSGVAPQPYFASVNRAPMAAADAEQIGALARQTYDRIIAESYMV